MCVGNTGSGYITIRFHDKLVMQGKTGSGTVSKSTRPLVVQLPEIVTSLQQPHPPAAIVRQYVHICHRLSHAYLLHKIANGRLDPNFFAISIPDLALDCIAAMFRRNEKGEFVRIKNYFSLFDVGSLSEDELLMRTRRLVFSSVNDELFRLYKDEDPSLGNVIRCIKSALKYIPEIFAERIDGEVWLYVEKEKRNETYLPVIPYELAFAMLSERFSFSMPVRRVIREFIDILKTQNRYRKRYPLTGLAYLIRSLYTSVGSTEPMASYPDDGILESELLDLIKESSASVKNKMEQRYINRNKLPRKTYSGFFRAIEDILEAQYVHNDGFDHSYFHFVKKHNTSISVNMYRNKHRSSFEYLVRLTREELIKKIKKDF